jgi:hypothetical protein
MVLRSKKPEGKAWRNALLELGQWPRGLSLEQAAAYAALPTKLFQQLGLFKLLKIGPAAIYDRHDIDRWLLAQGEWKRPRPHRWLPMLTKKGTLKGEGPRAHWRRLRMREAIKKLEHDR